MIRRLCLLALAFALPLSAADKKPSKPKSAKAKGEDKKAAALPYEVAEFVENDFPFFSSTLDAREAGEGLPKDNLTPRGLILNLGHNLWACYDVDLLRLSCVWEGEPGQPPITLVALAPRSYKDPGQKTKDGQDDLPKPVGNLWVASGIYPGWQVGEAPNLTDPREPAPSPEEVGRGPLKADSLLKDVRLRSIKHGDKVSTHHQTIDFTIGGTAVAATFGGSSKAEVSDAAVDYEVQPHAVPLVCVLGKVASGVTVARFMQKDAEESAAQLQITDGLRWVKLPPASKPVSFTVHFSATSKNRAATKSPYGQETAFWPQILTTKGTLSADTTSAYVMDDVALPTTNPWKRNVRLADIAFLDDQGHAAVVTMDGDVWMLSGLKGNLEKVEWKRFASGFHEPMSIVARPEKDGAPSLFINDRNGIWRLKDTKGTGEADVHEMFCNLFSQTAETREFPNSMKLGPKGELYISKGGQQGTTLGKDNGKVLRIAPDGKSYEAVAWGLRQPFIGVNEKTGLVTASDQQGNYVPSTPLHVIRDNQYYGFLTEQQPKEKYPAPIADPLTWIPHPVNPSGATQVWLNGARMGPLNDTMIHLAYSRADIFRVMFDERQTKAQAAICNIPLPIKFPPTNGHVNPADGQLYLVGFQIWGTTAERVSGLGRVRYNDKVKSVLPNDLAAMDKGILVRFDSPVDKTLAANPDNFSVERWNYKRTFDYGSAHYKLDGTTGQEILTASATYVSEDGKSVFVAVPDMKKCDQMHLGWNIKSADGAEMQNNAYFTPYNFAAFDPVKDGFGTLTVNLTPRIAVIKAVKPSVEEGKRLYQFIGCMGCHSVDGSVAGRLGPSWKGLFGSVRELSDDTKVVADEAYIRESILEPSKKKAKAYLKLETGMPIYAGILSDSQIESIILYMKTLAKK